MKPEQVRASPRRFTKTSGTGGAPRTASQASSARCGFLPEGKASLSTSLPPDQETGIRPVDHDVVEAEPDQLRHAEPGGQTSAPPRRPSGRSHGGSVDIAARRSPEDLERYTSPVLAEDADEVADGATVRRQRALADAPVDLHPMEEPLNQAHGGGTRRQRRNDVSLTQKAEELADR